MAAPLAQGVFRKEGEYWTVGLRDRPLRFKDSKGFVYLAHLLRHPTTEFHALDLVGGLTGHRGDEDAAGVDLGSDAGEMLDDRAKATYRRRLEELRAQLDVAEAAGSPAAAEAAEREIESLTAELRRAVGLHGRSRRVASAAERARQSVTKTARAVVERIRQGDATVGDLLARCIRTGTFCAYEPDPNEPIAWEFGAGTREPGVASPPVDVSPFPLAARAPLIGREHERDALGAAIERALGGHGSIVLLTGGPGVGKSRLAMEMADHAAGRGFRVLVGHCYERDDPVPFLPFAEILESGLARAASLDDYRRMMGDAAAELAQIAPRIRRAFPELPEPRDLPPQQRRRSLFQSFVETLGRSSRTRPELFVVEDLHWADESTLALLTHLAHGLAGMPVAIIGTLRPELDGPNPPLARTLEELLRAGIRPLRLGGLSRDETWQMLQTLGERRPSNRLANLLFDVTEGNAFFVQEVHQHLIEDGRVLDASGEFRSDITIDEIDVPDNVRLVIGRRLDRLDDSERKILMAAAVIGRSFSFQLVRLLLDHVHVDDLCDAVEKAQRMGLLVASAEGPETPFTFAHEMLRQALLQEIALPRRQRLHAGVAHAIERLHPRAAQERSGDIADHLLKAGAFAQRHELATALLAAGHAALGASAFEQAHSWFEVALEHQDDPTVRAEILSAMATADHGLGRIDEAFAHGSEAIDIHVAAGDRERIGRSFVDVVDGLMWARRYDDLVKVVHRGLKLLAGDRSAHRVRLLCQVALIRAAAGQYEPARDAFTEAMEIAQEVGDAALLVRVLSDRASLHYYFCQLEETLADGHAVELMSERPHRSAVDGWRLTWLERAAGLLGRPAQAAEFAQRLEPLSDDVGHRDAIVACRQMRAWIEFGESFDLTRLGDALARAEGAGHTAGPASSSPQPVDQMPSLSNVKPGGVVGITTYHACLVRFLRGEWEVAVGEAELAYAGSLPSAAQGALIGILLRQHAYLGNRARVLALLEETRSALPTPGRPNTIGAWNLLLQAIDGLTVLGERQQVVALRAFVPELVASGLVWMWSGPRLIRTAAGLAAAAAADWEAAEQHFMIAMQQADALPQRLEQVDLRRFRAMMLLDRGVPADRSAAGALLREAAHEYGRFAMPRHRELTERLLMAADA